jgi:hypothetical protein
MQFKPEIIESQVLPILGFLRFYCNWQPNPRTIDFRFDAELT